MLLSVSDLHKTYRQSDGDQPVLRGVSLQLNGGEAVALTGESGSGKSTLLNLIGLLDEADSGEIRIEGEVAAGLDDSARAHLRRRKIGLVFQQFNLIPSLDVAANLAFQARLAGREEARWTAHLGERLGLADFLHRYPEQLSGGQQQRVAIGRALAARPALLLADEPTGNLDEATSEEVMALMLDLVAETGAGFLMVTHSAKLAGQLDRRLHLSRGVLA